MQEIILIGGGGHCKSCIDVIEAQGKYKIAGVVDVKEKLGTKILGYSIIGTDSDFPALASSYKNFIITIGQISISDKRSNLFEELKEYNVTFPTIVSPFAYVSKHVKIGQGTIIMHHAVVNCDASIGQNCIINTKVLIEHDAIVEDSCHIATGAVINGGVKVGKGSFVGSGAVTKQYAIISPGTFIKALSIYKS